MALQAAVSLEALSDLCTPWCVHVVATLRIAEHLDAGLSDAADLARAADCDATLLELVLRHLVEKGVFEEPAPGRFALNDPARGLLDPGLRIGLDLDGFGGRMAHGWGTLLETVRTGRPAYQTRFGRPFWEDLDANPEIGAAFDTLMGPAGHGAPDPVIPLRDGWDAIRAVVDVGGGTGALLAEILRRRPEIRGTLIDLPRAVARSEETFRAADVADRVTAIGQSFFDPLPPGADLYLLMKVLNDWPDPEATAILRRCAEAARPDGRIAVVGGVSPNDVLSRLVVEMVLVGGKSRALDAFRALAGSAGLDMLATGYTPSGRFVVECRPT